ncbi:MAG TPA: hypothetical protein VIG69_05090 [Candidatus Methylomirabilis sp.]|jgi:hypothetical protein
MARVIGALVAAAAGGILGGYLAHRATLAGTRAALGEATRALERQRDAGEAPLRAARRERLTAALRAELETFVATYMEALGSQVELLSPGQPLVAPRPPQEYYFTIYDSNATELRDIFEPGEVDRIVRSYARAKGLLDALRGWETASGIEYPSDEDRFAAVGWAIDRLRQAHRELHRLLPGALAVLGAGATVATGEEGGAPNAGPGV